MRLGFSAIIFAAAICLAPDARAQNGSLPVLTQQAVTACENIMLTGGTLSGQSVLQGFVPIPAPGTDEAVGRGLMSGEDQVFVKIRRNSTACVVMVQDTIRREAGQAIEAWSSASGITLESRADGSREARRGQLYYWHTVAEGGINVIAVRRP